MPKLGLSQGLTRSAATMSVPGIIRNSLVMHHNYPREEVQPLSDGAAYFASVNPPDSTVNQYIEIGTTATLRATNFSTGGWFYFNVGSVGESTAMLTSKPASGDYKGFQILKNNSNNFEYRLGTGSIHSMSGSAVSTNKWYHVLVTYDGTTYKAYENGVFVQSDTQGTHVVSDGTFNIGRYYSGSSTLGAQGYICNVGYWSDVLTLAEIKSIMWKQHTDLTTGTDSESDDLVSWWNLDIDANDSHGSNNGTLT